MKIFYAFTRGFFKLLFRACYRHEVFGAENLPKGGAIIAANHASFYDPPLIATSCPEEIHYLARSELFQKPILSPLIRQLNAYPVTGTTEDLTSMKVVLQLLKDEKKVVIFPEGIRTFSGHLNPIKPGIGMLALRSNCPIIPTYLHGTFAVWPRTKWLPRLWGKTACIFGDPILLEPFYELDKKQAREALASSVQASIEKLKEGYVQKTFQK